MLMQNHWFKGGVRAVPGDSHVTIVPYFTVPEGKLDEFMAGVPTFLESTRKGTDKALYYGFATHGNQVFCREGYADAEGALAHVGDVGEALDKAVGLVGEGGLDLSLMGPAAELDKLRPAFEPLGAKFWETVDGGLWWNRE